MLRQEPKKPKPNATPHPALGAFRVFPWLFLVAIITVETFRHEAVPRETPPTGEPAGIPRQNAFSQLGWRDITRIHLIVIGIASLIDVPQSFAPMSD